MSAAGRIALVGPGRRRNGLAPFLAEWFQRAGYETAVGIGRDPDRTAADCTALGERLGQPVAAATDLGAALAEHRPDALVIACPAAGHLPALEAGLAAGLPTLCEKPMVLQGQEEALDRIVDGFVARGLALVENCQWPEVLPWMEELHPSLRGAEPRSVELGLGPVGRGREMVEDSLSHLLSLLQARLPVDRSTQVRGIEWEGRAEDAERLTLRFELVRPFAPVLAALHLTHCPTQPRPAWLAIDGLRADRRIRTPEYTIELCAAERSVAIDDPLGRLVYGFAQLIREAPLERIRSAGERSRERARLYRELLTSW